MIYENEDLNQEEEVYDCRKCGCISDIDICESCSAEVEKPYREQFERISIEEYLDY